MTKKRLWRFLPACVWYGVIWFFSSQTGAESQEVSDSVLGLVGYDIQSHPFAALSILLSFLVRKAAHMGVFFVLTGLLYWALKGMPKWRGWTALGLCAVLAALDECHQLFVPGRSGKWQDVCIDTLGGACFLVALFLLRTVKARKKA